MSNFKKASRIKLRVQSTLGLLSVEQLWDLPLSKLTPIIKEVKKDLSGSNIDDDLSFLSETVKVDEVKQLQFDILKEIYVTKKEEHDELRKKEDVKKHNQKILELIAKKQDENLNNLSIEELTKELK